MTNEILYMLGVVGVGFLVNYTLRALPFLLFAGRDRELPKWIESLSRYISPIIIACLVVYSYTGLKCSTPAPFIAGVLTIALQLWRRNPLLSIIAGTVVYMCLLNCGCVTARVMELDANHPAVTVRTTGIWMGEERVEAEDVAEILEDAEVDKSTTIHILLDGAERDLSGARKLMALLARAGYRRSVLVTRRHAESVTRKAGSKPVLSNTKTSTTTRRVKK